MKKNEQILHGPLICLKNMVKKNEYIAYCRNNTINILLILKKRGPEGLTCSVASFLVLK